MVLNALTAHAEWPTTLALHRLKRTGAFIDGRWREASSDGAVYQVFNPSDQSVLASVAQCGAIETEAAVMAASLALPAWANSRVKARSRLLRALFDLMTSHEETLAKLITLESGKPLAEARGEVAYGAAYVEWFAEQAKRLKGEIIPAPSPDRRILVTREAVGVVACITPWNFPIAMLVRKVAPALAAGCTVVCKPSEETPLSGLAIAELTRQAGFPPGVVNMISGRAAEIGSALTASPLVRKLTFTGSTAVGKRLMADCAPTMKRTSMELGGNAPFIVFDDADLERAVAGLMAAKFRNAGQTCICANRILVQAGVAETFLDLLKARIESLLLGDGQSPDVLIGPLIHSMAADRVRGLIEDAVAQGARIVAQTPSPALPPAFVRPTLLDRVSPTMRIWNEEIFGPVAAVHIFTDEADAIEAANGTPSGLAAYVYSQDMSRVLRLSDALQFGMIGANEAAISNEMAPFGGVKESGHGREGSVHGLDDYLDLKYLCLGGLTS